MSKPAAVTIPTGAGPVPALLTEPSIGANGRAALLIDGDGAPRELAARLSDRGYHVVQVDVVQVEPSRSIAGVFRWMASHAPAQILFIGFGLGASVALRIGAAAGAPEPEGVALLYPPVGGDIGIIDPQSLELVHRIVDSSVPLLVAFRDDVDQASLGDLLHLLAKAGPRAQVRFAPSPDCMDDVTDWLGHPIA